MKENDFDVIIERYKRYKRRKDADKATEKQSKYKIEVFIIDKNRLIKVINIDTLKQYFEVNSDNLKKAVLEVSKKNSDRLLFVKNHKDRGVIEFINEKTTKFYNEYYIENPVFFTDITGLIGNCYNGLFYFIDKNNLKKVKSERMFSYLMYDKFLIVDIDDLQTAYSILSSDFDDNKASEFIHFLKKKYELEKEEKSLVDEIYGKKFEVIDKDEK